MDLHVFRSLLTPPGQSALQTASGYPANKADFLPQFSALSRQYPPELARAALQTAILRVEAQSKFPHAGRMYFTRLALEQASGWVISNYRARRYQEFELLLDLGCSIGSDTLAFGEQAYTIGFDRDALRLAMAQANAAALDQQLRAEFVLADLYAPLPGRFSQPTALFFDPARRVEGRRVFSVHDYTPPLAIIQRWLPDFPALGVKVSPGVKMDQLEEYDAEVEFISIQGDLKEAVLWFGPLKRAHRRATILPGPHTMASHEVLQEREPLPLSEPRAYLYEPDPAILRSGLVQDLGWHLNAAQLDVDIAYLTGDQPIETPFARCWKTEDWLPFGLKRLRSILRERDVGRVTVKKRGSPLQPEQLIRQLRLKKDSGGERVLFLTHLKGRPIVVICYP